jgi:type IV pilus assembly protein PilE
MIAVAILGILVAIAVPSYQEHLRKGRRAEAQAFVTQVAQRQQQYLLDARTYALGGAALTELGMAAPTSVANHYAVTVTPAAPTVPPSFTVTATPTSSAQIPDGTLTLDNTGAKQRLVGAADKGW